MVGGQVLHQHKGHAGLGVGRHAGEKGLERGQAAGGGTHANDGKGGIRRDFTGRATDRRAEVQRQGLRVRFGLCLGLCFFPCHAVVPVSA